MIPPSKSFSKQMYWYENISNQTKLKPQFYFRARLPKKEGVKISLKAWLPHLDMAIRDGVARVVPKSKYYFVICIHIRRFTLTSFLGIYFSKMLKKILPNSPLASPCNWYFLLHCFFRGAKSFSPSSYLLSSAPSRPEVIVVSVFIGLGD